MSGLQGREREKVGQEKRGIYKIYMYIYIKESEGKKEIAIVFPDKLITFFPPCLSGYANYRGCKTIAFYLRLRVQSSAMGNGFFDTRRGPDGLRLVPTPSPSPFYLPPSCTRHRNLFLYFMGQECW